MIAVNVQTKNLFSVSQDNKQISGLSGQDHSCVFQISSRVHIPKLVEICSLSTELVKKQKEAF